MKGPKSRISAIDWAKSQAVGQLRAIAAEFAAQSPQTLAWKVGRTIRTEPNVILSIHDTEFGIEVHRLIPLYLTYMRMVEEVGEAAQSVAFQRTAMLLTIAKHKSS